jgi:hypothetical protein
LSFLVQPSVAIQKVKRQFLLLELLERPSD